MLQAANDRAEARAASPEMARIFAAPLDPSWQGEGRDSTAPECQASHGRHRTAFALRSPSVVGLSKEEKPLSTAANERTAKLQGRRSSILARSETFPFSTVCEPEGAETTASLASGGTKPTEEVAAAGVGRAEAVQDDGLSQQQNPKEIAFSRSASTGTCTASTPTSAKSSVLSEEGSSVSQARATPPTERGDVRAQRRSPSAETELRDDLKVVVSPLGKDSSSAFSNLNTEKQLKLASVSPLCFSELALGLERDVDCEGGHPGKPEVECSSGDEVAVSADCRLEPLQGSRREFRKTRRTQLEKSLPRVSTVPLASTILADRRCVFFKTQMCPHARRGRCRLDKNCSFAHSEKELRAPPKLDKTKMCVSVKAGVACSKGSSCSFAHSRDELRHTVTFYKTNMCRSWQAGECPHPDTCNHAHGVHELLFFRTLAAGAGCRDFKKEKEGRKRLLPGDDGVEAAKSRAGHPPGCSPDPSVRIECSIEAENVFAGATSEAAWRDEAAGVERAALSGRSRKNLVGLQGLHHRCGTPKSASLSPGSCGSEDGSPSACANNSRMQSDQRADGCSSYVVHPAEVTASSSGQGRAARGDAGEHFEVNVAMAQDMRTRGEPVPQRDYQGEAASVARRKLSGSAPSSESSVAVGQLPERMTGWEEKNGDGGDHGRRREISVDMTGEQQQAGSRTETRSLKEVSDTGRRQLLDDARYGQAGGSPPPLAKPARTAEVADSELIAALGALLEDCAGVSLKRGLVRQQLYQLRSTSSKQTGGDRRDTKQRKDRGEIAGVRLRHGRRRGGVRTKAVPNRRREKRQGCSAPAEEHTPAPPHRRTEVGDPDSGADNEKGQGGKVAGQDRSDPNQAIMALVYSLWLRLQQASEGEDDRGTGRHPLPGDLQSEYVSGHSEGLRVAGSDSAVKAAVPVSTAASSLQSSLLFALRDAVARVVTCSLEGPSFPASKSEKSNPSFGCTAECGAPASPLAFVEKSRREQLGPEGNMPAPRSRAPPGSANAPPRLLPAAERSDSTGKAKMAQHLELSSGRRRTVGWPVVPVSRAVDNKELSRRAVTRVQSFDLAGGGAGGLRLNRGVETGESSQRLSEASNMSGHQQPAWEGGSGDHSVSCLRDTRGARDVGGRTLEETLEQEFCGVAESILRSDSSGSVNSRGGVNSEMTSVSTLPSFSGLCGDGSPGSARAELGCLYQTVAEMTCLLERPHCGTDRGKNGCADLPRNTEPSDTSTDTLDSGLRTLVASRSRRSSCARQRRFSPGALGDNGEVGPRKISIGLGLDAYRGDASSSSPPGGCLSNSGDGCVLRETLPKESVLWRISSSQATAGEQAGIEETPLKPRGSGTQEKGLGRDRKAEHAEPPDRVSRVLTNGPPQGMPAQLLLTQAVFGPQWRKDLCEVATSTVDPVLLIESMMQALGLEG